MGIFERYLSVWVGVCILLGVLLGNAVPGVFAALAAFEFARVNLVVAVLIWIMIYPMMGCCGSWRTRSCYQQRVVFTF